MHNKPGCAARLSTFRGGHTVARGLHGPLESRVELGVCHDLECLGHATLHGLLGRRASQARRKFSDESAPLHGSFVAMGDLREFSSERTTLIGLIVEKHPDDRGSHRRTIARRHDAAG